MPLISSITSADAWRNIIGIAKGLNNNIPAWNARLAEGNTTVEYVFGIYKNLRDDRLRLETLKATTNLNTYVKDVRGDSAYDAVAEISTVTAAIQSAIDWIDTNASGLSLTGDSAENALANNSIVTNRFGAPATAPLRTLMTAITDAIQDA